MIIAGNHWGSLREGSKFCNDFFEKVKNFPSINRNGNFFLFLVQLRKSFGPTQQDGEWRIKLDQELRDSDNVEEVKNRILSWTAYSESVRADFDNQSAARKHPREEDLLGSGLT